MFYRHFTSEPSVHFCVKTVQCSLVFPSWLFPFPHWLLTQRLSSSHQRFVSFISDVFHLQYSILDRDPVLLSGAPPSSSAQSMCHTCYTLGTPSTKVDPSVSTMWYHPFVPSILFQAIQISASYLKQILSWQTPYLHNYWPNFLCSVSFCNS